MMRGAFLKSAAKVEVFSAKMLHSSGEKSKISKKVIPSCLKLHNYKLLYPLLCHPLLQTQDC